VVFIPLAFSALRPFSFELFIQQATSRKLTTKQQARDKNKKNGGACVKCHGRKGEPQTQNAGSAGSLSNSAIVEKWREKHRNVPTIFMATVSWIMCEKIICALYAASVTFEFEPS
jgi:hypothetical protein